MTVLRKSSYVFFTISMFFLFMVLLGQTNSSEKNTLKNGLQYVQANPNPIEIVQPDSSKLTIVLTGDEKISYARTTDGYTLLQSEGGIYYYAVLSADGDLVISGTKASNAENRSIGEDQFMQQIKAKLEYSDKQKKEKIGKWKKAGKTSGLSRAQFGPIDNAFPSTGTRKMLVILAAFSDKAFVKTNANFNTIMNVGTTSFKSYYLANSYNALDVTTTVVGPYTIPMTMSAADANTRDFIARAVDAANTAGLDFSQFDNNGDGAMDSLYVIHAGFGEEAGAPTYTIWSHSWDLATYARNYDGVSISSYATSPELRGASGTSITSIGVICHEFGHNIGVPDYYDTDGTGSGGSAWDLKSWDVMAGGSWNNSGDTPAQHNMYTKYKLGWSTPTVLTATGNKTLGNTVDNNSAYRINTTTTNEFFILENRQQIGWDAYIGGHGMLIFHIDGNFIDGLTTNTVNANPSHLGVDIEEADNVRSTTTYGADPFPGTGNKTSFTDTTTPNSKSWANANTAKPITSIAEASGQISFTITVGGITYCTAAGTDWSDEWIAKVQLGTINKTSTGTGYSDFTTVSTNLTRGASTSLTLTPGFAGSAYSEYWIVWIDYNKDGDFADTGEKVYQGYGTTAKTGSFTVSSTASTGTTRMRIAMKYGAYATSSCGTFSYGEVEDYTVNIL